jgi:protein-S-isoprenylcysteine O-methyltransferase Ste14
MLKILKAISKLLIGIIIFIGLPLVAWGIKDVAGFFSNPVRLAFVILTIVLQIIIIMKIPEAGSDRGATLKVVHRQRVVVWLLQLIMLAIFIFAPYCDRRMIMVFDDSNLIRVLGLILYVPSLFIMHWAEVYLADMFCVDVAIKDNHRLITTGPFRYIRHPRYLGIVLFSVGVSLIFLSWLSLVTVALLILVLLWRIYDEEALMYQHFQAEWEQYRKRSWRLIPYVF